MYGLYGSDYISRVNIRQLLFHSFCHEEFSVSVLESHQWELFEFMQSYVIMNPIRLLKRVGG